MNDHGRFQDLTDGQLQVIHDTCETFERALISNRPNSIEEHLDRCQEVIQTPLLCELLAIELEWKLRKGDRPEMATYLDRFQRNATDVQKVFTRIQNQHQSIPSSQSVEFASTRTINGTDACPERIGRYRVDGLLGHGGFGVVYRAQDEQLERAVAIKVPHVRLVLQRELADAYLTEARSMAMLNHPHIVPVYDVGSDSAFPCYIVSRYVDGISLAKHIARNHLDYTEVAQLVATLATTLQYAHDQGLVHRDVKPSNILIDASSCPYLVDFGIALSEARIGSGPEYVGTPAYMSPEQARGEGHRVDGRSDIFSLGVVFYELLVGRRPFYACTLRQTLELIVHHDPVPPRQIDKRLPRDLERICLKALSKRAVERYSTAQDLAEDLSLYLSQGRHFTYPSKRNSSRNVLADSSPRVANEPNTSIASATSTETRPQSTIDRSTGKMVPKGLRSYDSADADFFLDLLPGPRDREGLPDSIRFWKSRIESTSTELTFAVGLIYGPSGCGKSSLVKAGLLPNLLDRVTTVYLEADADGTESRLLAAIHNRYPALPRDLSLKDTLTTLRQGSGPSDATKLLIVLDQFEQWLHASQDKEHSELTDALRQCDGRNVQCLAMVRDEFWMAATRWMHALEIPLQAGRNANVVDLFSIRHAEKVLVAIGRAFGALPEHDHELTRSQHEFVRLAVQGIAEGGKVVCVRLALFAQMMQDRDWSPSTLKHMGGANGVGITFLEESLSSPDAKPEYRYHQAAARSMLTALLPELGVNIKGSLRSEDTLLAASGYADRRRDFDDVLRILDHDLRLITPATRDSTNAEHHTSVSVAEDPKYYQLTHDYLVPSLREWLTRKQRERARGRAELRLAERSMLWNAKPENSLLPSLVDWITLRCLTNSTHWTDSQRTMMRYASRYHRLRWSSIGLVVLGMGIAIHQSLTAMHRRSLTAQIKTSVDALQHASGPTVPHILAKLSEFPSTMLVSELQDRMVPRINDGSRLPLSFALARSGHVDTKYLVAQIRGAPTLDMDNFIAAFNSDKSNSLQALRLAIESARSNHDWPYAARLGIMALHLGDTSLAKDMCRLQPDPTERSWFIHEFMTWHGDIRQAAEYANATDDPAWRSALCLAVGQIPVRSIPLTAQQTWKALAFDWYEHAPDTIVHSAAQYLIHKWHFTPPTIDSSRECLGPKQWYFNSVGISMLTIPAGRFSRPISVDAQDQNQVVTLTRAYLLSDREISGRVFHEFVQATNYPEREKPQAWPGEDRTISTSLDHPVQEINWYDAVLFCNWLSQREGLTPCYERTGQEDPVERRGLEEWRLLPSANGYRLPTEAEWEHACRANTVTAYPFGNDDNLLDQYAVFRTAVTEPCGSKLPNAWGLFDMSGNVLEWCQDWAGQYPRELSLSDPSGVHAAPMRVMRGGTFFNLAQVCRSSDRNGSGPWGRSNFNGFRVARSLAK